MRTLEEIKNGLEHCRNNAPCIECPYYDKRNQRYSCEDELLDNALTYIQQLEVQMPRWISAKERLPEDEDKCVLAVASGHMKNCVFVDALMIAHYYPDEGWVIEGWEEWENPTVTHWMPLPEPPKEE